MKEGLPETLKLRYCWRCLALSCLPGSDDEGLDEGCGAAWAGARAKAAVDRIPRGALAASGFEVVAEPIHGKPLLRAQQEAVGVVLVETAAHRTGGLATGNSALVADLCGQDVVIE